jgi:hypothetical protein
MARLNQIEIRESDVTYTNQRDWFFHPTGHHVRELLLHYLPRDYVLDGSSKFCLVFGPVPDGELACETILGVTVRYVEAFDVEQYMTLPIAEQQEIILDALTKAMTGVARSAGSDPGVIQQAADQVRQNLFSAEIPVKKLNRSTRDRRLRIEVFRCLGPQLGEVWEARVFSRDGTLLGIETITDRPDCLDRTEQFVKSQWSGNVFEIVCPRLDWVEYRLDTAKYLEQAGAGR